MHGGISIAAIIPPTRVLAVSETSRTSPEPEPLRRCVIPCATLRFGPMGSASTRVVVVCIEDVDGAGEFDLEYVSGPEEGDSALATMDADLPSFIVERMSLMRCRAPAI